MLTRNHLVIIKSNVRNTSCSRGWLRTTVECLFGFLTVCSFILILLLSIRSNDRTTAPKCTSHVCKVSCEDVIYSSEIEEEIIMSFSLAEMDCEYRFLFLHGPRFPNSTLPETWLSRLRYLVHSVIISGGNLKHIAPRAFETFFGGSVSRLVFENIKITNWGPDMLIGLSSLQELAMYRCTFGNILENALEPVSETLNRLIITDSDNWDPKNLTGTISLPSLQSVIFSYNHFEHIIIGERSFTQLSNCQYLYLDNSGLTSIGANAFDNLTKIRVLNLNNNYLTTLPDGLFDNIINVMDNTHKPRINLQNNNWVCDCNQKELLRLLAEGLLVANPLCSSSEGCCVISVSQLEVYCRDNLSLTRRYETENIWDYIYANGSCNETNNHLTGTKFISPLAGLSCSASMFTRLTHSIESNSGENKPLKNEIISPTFALQANQNFMVEISSNKNKIQTGYGLVWYQSKCPSEIYCINALPNYLRVYNLDEHGLYTFCPLKLQSGTIERSQCISYSVGLDVARFKLRYIFFAASGVGLLALGAIGVYVLIQKYPTLLRGNKRILFVKHKQVDALILPPKVPLRPDLLDEKLVTDFNAKEIFTICSKNSTIPQGFLRTMSLRSTKSSAPSYISALEPTESQLQEWRLRNLDGLTNETPLERTSLTTSHLYYTDDSSIYYSIGESSTKSLDLTDFNYERL